MLTHFDLMRIAQRQQRPAYADNVDITALPDVSTDYLFGMKEP